MKENLGLVEAVKICLSKYATFEGRARRSEYWWWTLATFIVGIIVSFIPVLNLLVPLALFVPGIAVAVRRLHDLNKSGWWWWLGIIPVVGTIILIVWYATAGTVGPNQYGEDPKA